MRIDDDPRRLEKAGRPFGLTHKEREAVAGLLKHGNKAKALRDAGYSETMAKKNADRVFRKPHVAAFMRDQLQRAFDHERMNNGEILARLARLARADPRNLFNPDGTLKGVHELDDATAAAVRTFDVRSVRREAEGEGDDAKPAATFTVGKIKMADPLPALRTLAQIEGLLQPDQTVNVFVDMDARLDAARARRRAAEKLVNKDGEVVSDQ